MLWPNWIVNLLSALPIATNLQEKYQACNAEKELLRDEISRLKDDVRILTKEIEVRDLQLDQLRPDTLNGADDSILCMIAGDADDYVAPETIAEHLHVNRHEIKLRMDVLADKKYLAWHNGEYALTRKARVYLQTVGALSKLSNDLKG